jgi:hypothetical protein
MAFFVSGVLLGTLRHRELTRLVNERSGSNDSNPTTVSTDATYDQAVLGCSTDARYNPRDQWDELLSAGTSGHAPMARVNPVTQNAPERKKNHITVPAATRTLGPMNGTAAWRNQPTRTREPLSQHDRLIPRGLQASAAISVIFIIITFMNSRHILHQGLRWAGLVVEHKQWGYTL